MVNPFAIANEGEVQALAERDPRLEPLMVAVLARVGSSDRLVGGRPRPPLEALLRAVVGQQLSGAAASTIFARLLALLPPSGLTPANVLALSHADLRSVGLSSMKARFVHSICSAVENGALDLPMINAMPDADAAEALQSVPGIGQWTASMYLIFQLRRPDVLPCQDVGVQRGLQLAYALRERPSADYVMRAGRKWSPTRTLACRFLWTALNEGIEAEAVETARRMLRRKKRS